MNLKGSQTDINSQTVRLFVQLLVENKKNLLRDIKAQTELSKLKNFLIKLEDTIWETRSGTASKKLSQMTEEERRIILMWPDEKAFFLEYKKKNPRNPWAYFKEYQKKIQEEFKNSQKIPQKQTV